MELIGKAIVVWFGLMVLAVANGAFREGILARRIGPGAAHVVSTLMLSVAIAVAAGLTGPWIGITTAGEGARVGFCWLTLTLAFEFLVGHFLFGNSWEKILADYNVFRGRIWLLVPLTTVAAPFVEGLRR